MMYLYGILLAAIWFFFGLLVGRAIGRAQIVKGYLVGFQDGVTGNLGMLYQVPKDIRAKFGLNFEDFPEFQGELWNKDSKSSDF